MDHHPPLLLHSLLGIDQLYSEYNLLVQKVSTYAGDSLSVHNRTIRLYQDIRHLNSQVKAWTRLLALGSIQTLSPSSVIGLQAERLRIYNELRSVEDRVESCRVANVIQRAGNILIQQHLLQLESSSSGGGGERRLRQEHSIPSAAASPSSASNTTTTTTTTIYPLSSISNNNSTEFISDTESTLSSSHYYPISEFSSNTAD